jgi:hypothetical protein
MIDAVTLDGRDPLDTSRRMKEAPVMKHTIAAATVALFLIAVPLVAFAQSAPATGRDRLARALQRAWLPLESGLIVSSTQGTPISGKYEIDDGVFQLSVDTGKVDDYSGDTFVEVVVDYSTGTIARVEVMTDGGDIAAAQAQKAAMAATQQSLAVATAGVVKANAGYRAVSATPSLDGLRPVIEVLLVHGNEWKLVAEPLD